MTNPAVRIADYFDQVFRWEGRVAEIKANIARGKERGSRIDFSTILAQAEATLAGWKTLLDSAEQDAPRDVLVKAWDSILRRLESESADSRTGEGRKALLDDAHGKLVVRYADLLMPSAERVTASPQAAAE